VSALPDLDPLIHAPTRLRIMSTLAVLDTDEQLAFTRLQSLLDLTAGNLITHLRKLEHAHYITTTKQHDNGTTATTNIRLTTNGRRAFQDYTTTLRAWLDTTPTP
jgi:DNA-binding MarR family transcriptional regulator